MALEARVLRTLDDPELRRILAELPPAYANLTLWEDRIARLMEERVFPQLWLHVPQMNMEIAAAYGGTGPLWEEFVESVPSQSRFTDAPLGRGC